MVLATDHERVSRTVCLRLLTMLALMLGAPTNSSAQTAAEHAGQAHGHPIVNGTDIQPTPRVVEKRLYHYRQMLRAEHDEAAGVPAKPPNAGAVIVAKPSISPPGSQTGGDRRDTEQLCHDLLHGGKRPADAASNPQRCE